MAVFFPRMAPFATHSLSVSDGHALAIFEYGTPTGVPIVYLHGGPGGSTPPDVPRLFDPEVWRVVCFDQRGCGRSTCADRLRGNTTEHLLSDVEAVRTALSITSWGVMGSSYGSLLAALYAARNPASVQWVLLHGVFMGSDAEVAWLFEPDGAARFYPQQWAEVKVGATLAGDPCDEAEAAAPSSEMMLAEAAVASLPDAFAGRPALLAAYHALLAGPTVPRAHPPPSASADEEQPSLAPAPAEGASPAMAQVAVPAASLAAARALARWEDEMETLVPQPATHEASELLASAQIAVHHFMHGCFMPADGALPELRAARQTLEVIPCAIVHGRHDVLCPPHTASALHAAWPHSTLRIVEAGAHALFEKPMRVAAQLCLLELREGRGGAGQPAAAEDGGKAKKRRR